MNETGQDTASAEILGAAPQMEEAFGRGDAAAVAAFYTENASYCGTMVGLVTGRAAIQAAFEKLAAAGLKRMTIEATETNVQGDQAYTVIHYRFFDAGNQLRASGNALTLWERQGGGWRINHHWGVGDSEPK